MIKILLAAVVAVSRIGASTQQDLPESLWAVSTGGTFSVCENPSSQASLDTCFSGDGGSSSPMTTDGINVYRYVPGDGGSIVNSIVICPISGLGDGCSDPTTFGGTLPVNNGPTDIPVSNVPLSMAASPDYIYLGYQVAQGSIGTNPNNIMYRCPLDANSGGCVQFNNSGDRPINSLLFANEMLYAGLGQNSESGNGLIWKCDPITANSCEDLDDPGKTDVSTLAVGASAPGYLWAGLNPGSENPNPNGIIWRCPLDEANSCVNWYEITDEVVQSISFDAEDGTTFYAGTYNDVTFSGGSIYTCSTNGGCTRSLITGDAVNSVAGGTSSVFWSLGDQTGSESPFYIYMGHLHLQLILMHHMLYLQVIIGGMLNFSTFLGLH